MIPPIRGCLVWGIGIVVAERLGGLSTETRLGTLEISICTRIGKEQEVAFNDTTD